MLSALSAKEVSDIVNHKVGFYCKNVYFSQMIMAHHFFFSVESTVKAQIKLRFSSD